MIFIYLLAFLAVLWFLDEILTVIEIRKYGLARERNPIIRRFIQRNGHLFFYFKVLTYGVFCALALLAYSLNQVTFYMLVTIAIVIYGIIDYKSLDVLKK